VAAVVAAPSSARALTFNVTYDPSTASAPPAFFTAMSDAFQYYQSLYTDPITINIHVGWGDINGTPLGAGFLGQSLTAQPGSYTYATIRTALIDDAKTLDDVQAVSTLPAADPTGGRSFTLSNAEAKAIGLLSGTATAIDGWVGFSTAVTWTFDPNVRGAPGAYDFLGTAHHEITEVMGRYGYGQNGGGARDSPIDLFRYFSQGVRDLTPAYNSAVNYFSIDGGASGIDPHTFNRTCCGDLSDWASGTNDSFNTFSSSGVKNGTSLGDRLVMDVLGYDRVQWADTPLVPGTTVVKAVHIIEIRNRIGLARSRHGMSAYAYSRSVAAGLEALASDILETRSALHDIYVATATTEPAYTLTPAPGATISGLNILQLRAFLELIEDG
jgi:hypothetical protein